MRVTIAMSPFREVLLTLGQEEGVLHDIHEEWDAFMCTLVTLGKDARWARYVMENGEVLDKQLRLLHAESGYLERLVSHTNYTLEDEEDPFQWAREWQTGVGPAGTKGLPIVGAKNG